MAPLTAPGKRVRVNGELPVYGSAAIAAENLTGENRQLPKEKAAVPALSRPGTEFVDCLQLHKAHDGRSPRKPPIQGCAVVSPLLKRRNTYGRFQGEGNRPFHE